MPHLPVVHSPEGMIVCVITTRDAAVLADDADATGAHATLRHAIATFVDVGQRQVKLHPAQRDAKNRLRPAWAELAHTRRKPTKLWTSLGRSPEVIVIGFGPTPMGVDVEACQTLGQARDLARVFHPSDRLQFSQKVPHGDFPLQVSAGWARKEAMLKAQATGLRQDPGAHPVGTIDHPLSPHGWDSTSLPISALGGHDVDVVDTLSRATHMVGVAWRSRRKRHSQPRPRVVSRIAGPRGTTLVRIL